MPARTWRITDPGDLELHQAWDEWKFCVSQSASNPGWEAKAREWRLMYLSLLDRKDRLFAAAKRSDHA